MSRHRLEITLDDEQWAGLDVARGHEPRASFVKRAVGLLVGMEAVERTLPHVGSSPLLEPHRFEAERQAVGPRLRAGRPTCAFSPGR